MFMYALGFQTKYQYQYVKIYFKDYLKIYPAPLLPLLLPPSTQQYYKVSCAFISL